MHVLSDRATHSAQQVNWKPGWLELLTYRQTWAVVIGRFITDPIWWLYIFWLPSYFPEARGFSLQQVGMSAWLPFLCAGIGALLMPAGILAMRAESPCTALVPMGIVLFGFQVWISNLQTLPRDVFPKSAVASVFGLGGTSAAIASVLFNWGTGRVVDAMGYTPMFVIAGVLGPLGLVATVLPVGRVTPLKESELRQAGPPRRRIARDGLPPTRDIAQDRDMAPRERGRVVYSTGSGRMCPGCGWPVDNCTCSTRAANAPVPVRVVAKLRIEKAGRGGKTVSVVYDLPRNAAFLKDLAQDLKRACGTGGTVLEDRIELQGDLRDRIRERLLQKGFGVKG